MNKRTKWNKKNAAVLAIIGGMVLGMSVQASSPSTSTTSAGQEANDLAVPMAEGVSVDSQTVKADGVEVSPELAAQIIINPVTWGEVNGTDQKVLSEISSSASVLKMFDVIVPDELKGKKITITFQVSAVKPGQKIVIYHQLNDETWEQIQPDSVEEGQVTGTFTSFSPVAFVAYNQSAKTLHAEPIIPVFIMISFIGVIILSVSFISKKRGGLKKS